MPEYPTLRYYIDGGLTRRPGEPTPIGQFSVRLVSPFDEYVHKQSAGPGYNTRHQADLLALIHVQLHVTYKLQTPAHVLIHTDNKLLLNQVLGKKKSRSPKIQTLLYIYKDELARLRKDGHQIGFVKSSPVRIAEVMNAPAPIGLGLIL